MVPLKEETAIKKAHKLLLEDFDNADIDWFFQVILEWRVCIIQYLVKTLQFKN